MPCPRCGTHNLWDDNLWWGCYGKDCGFMSDRIHNTSDRLDSFNGDFGLDPWQLKQVKKLAEDAGENWDALNTDQKRVHVRAHYIAFPRA